MATYKCPRCKSEDIKEVMYNDYGTLYAMLECKKCGEAGEYSYFDVPGYNKALNRERAKSGSDSESSR